jgi:predicted cupin superfamily sugar epimerase
VTHPLVAALSLKPHPEGGFYRETFRSPLRVQTKLGERAASTAIYFLLTAGTFSAFHRVFGDEAWHFYGGSPLELHLLDGRGHTVHVLDPAAPQAVVPDGVWQAARTTGAYSFVGCTVAPGFEFKDFEMAAKDALARAYPTHKDIVHALTR